MLAQTPLEATVLKLIEAPVATAGFRVVRVRYMSGNHRKTLQIMIEHLDAGKAITVNDCEEVSYLLSAILDVEDPISDEYNLEISSPGIDRPLVRIADFENYKGLEARITTRELIEGRRKFTGRLLGVLDGNTVLIDYKDGNQMVRAQIPFEMVESAKLVMSDELLDWSAAQMKPANQNGKE
jgi:ribosome maturation factor RimP